MSDGVRVAGDPAATVHAERAGSGEPRPEGQNDSRSFTPGQAVELAVQVGSWKEGTPCLIVNQEPSWSPYEWRVTVQRDCGALDASMYEHELRPRQPSRLEQLVAEASRESLAWYKDWRLKETPSYPWDAVGFSQPDENGVVTFRIINNQADGEDPFGAAVDALFEEAINLLLSKHHDYGPRNISQAPGGALNGLQVRLWDKFARINHLLDSGADPENESLRDSFLDAMNYCAIAILCMDGAWPE